MNPTRAVRADDIVAALREAVPVLKDNAERTERDRRLAPMTVEALAGTGVFDMAVPTRFGGPQIPLPQQVEALAEIARGCGSASWCTAIYFTASWLVGLLPDEAAEEVFTDPGVRTAVSSAPAGRLARKGRDYVLDGSWSFNTGVHHARWDLLGAVLDGEHVLVLVPQSSLAVHDDWDTSGLAGTGSDSVSVSGLRVPAHRVLPFPDAGRSRSDRHPSAGEDFYWYELYPLFSAVNSGPALGLAHAAVDFFAQHVQGRPITFTRYGDQSQAPATHRQLGEAQMKILAATALSGRLADRVHCRAADRTAHTLAERAEARALAAYSTQLAREAVEIVQSASGASSIRRGVPIQRLARDVRAMSLHAALNTESALEIHGRVRLRLDPGTTFL